MKQQTTHNIICLEAEWEYSEQNLKNRFSLNTLPMLNWLKEAYDCEVIYRRFRTKSDSQNSPGTGANRYQSKGCWLQVPDRRYYDND